MLRNPYYNNTVNAQLLSFLQSPATHSLGVLTVTPSSILPSRFVFSPQYWNRLLDVCQENPSVRDSVLRMIRDFLKWEPNRAALSSFYTEDATQNRQHVLRFVKWLVQRCSVTTVLECEEVLCLRHAGDSGVTQRDDRWFVAACEDTLVLDGVFITAGMWYYEVEWKGACRVGIMNGENDEDVLIASMEEETGRMGCLIDMDHCTVTYRSNDKEVEEQKFGKVACVLPVIEMSAHCEVRVVSREWEWNPGEGVCCLEDGCEKEQRWHIRKEEKESEEVRLMRNVVAELWDVWDMRSALEKEEEEALECIVVREGRVSELLRKSDDRVITSLMKEDVLLDEDALALLMQIADSAESSLLLQYIDYLVTHSHESYRMNGLRLLIHCLERRCVFSLKRIQRRARFLLNAARTRSLTKEETVHVLHSTHT